MAVDDGYTKALLHFDLADASTTPIDESGKTWTRAVPSGTSEADTAAYKFGTASWKFAPHGYIYADGSADFAFGTGDFTIDFQVYLTAIGNGPTFIDFRPSTSAGNYISIWQNNSKLNLEVNGSNVITDTVNFPQNEWVHVAVARSGTSTKLFKGGVQVASTWTDSTNYIVGANRPAVGNGYNLSYGITGWIDELRISKGIARWTADFTPPIAAYQPGGCQVIMFS